MSLDFRLPFSSLYVFWCIEIKLRAMNWTLRVPLFPEPLTVQWRRQHWHPITRSAFLALEQQNNCSVIIIRATNWLWSGGTKMPRSCMAYAEFFLLEYDAIYSGESQSTFRGNASSPYLGSKSKASKDWKVRQATNQQNSTLSCCFVDCLTSRPWRRRWYVSPKRHAFCVLLTSCWFLAGVAVRPWTWRHVFPKRQFIPPDYMALYPRE